MAHEGVASWQQEPGSRPSRFPRYPNRSRPDPLGGPRVKIMIESLLAKAAKARGRIRGEEESNERLYPGMFRIAKFTALANLNSIQTAEGCSQVL